MPAPKAISFDNEIAPHAPDLYDYAAIADTIDGLDAITDAEIARYHEQDFIMMARGAFTQEEVRSALDGLNDLIADRIPGFQWKVWSNIE